MKSAMHCLTSVPLARRYCLPNLDRRRECAWRCSMFLHPHSVGLRSTPLDGCGVGYSRLPDGNIWRKIKTRPKPRKANANIALTEALAFTSVLSARQYYPPNLARRRKCAWRHLMFPHLRSVGLHSTPLDGCGVGRGV